MLARSLLFGALVFAGVSWVQGQVSETDADGASQHEWRGPAANSDLTPTETQAPESVGSRSPMREATAPSSQRPGGARQPGESGRAETGRLNARVASGNGELPREHGQIYRQYDISPYTLRVTSTNRPELAVVDWILRETGYEAWHSEALAVLNPTRRTLRVYHTPEMQQVVADIVERFVSTEAETHAFGLRVVTLSHPNWRARAQRLLRPAPVQTPGVRAWLLYQEDAALLLSELRRRPDYREHNSPHLLVNNGQSTVVSATRARNYIGGAVLRTGPFPGLEPETAVIDEGFSLEFSPLVSADGRVVDASIQCEIIQVEKMIPISLDVPATPASPQRTNVEVPQVSQFHFHERFRWPVEQVLLVGMGMVALPVPSDGESLIPGLPLPLPRSPARADLLVFVEGRVRGGQGPRVTRSGGPATTTYRDRY